MFSGAMKSLFKSGARDLKSKFSKTQEIDEFPAPLGFRIGAAVDIDTIPLRMNADQLHVELPEETMLIVAQGYIELGDATYVHRYYDAKDTMIQVFTVAGMEDHHVEELTLYTLDLEAARRAQQQELARLAQVEAENAALAARLARIEAALAGR